MLALTELEENALYVAIRRICDITRTSDPYHQTFHDLKEKLEWHPDALAESWTNE